MASAAKRKKLKSPEDSATADEGGGDVGDQSAAVGRKSTGNPRRFLATTAAPMPGLFGGVGGGGQVVGADGSIVTVVGSADAAAGQVETSATPRCPYCKAPMKSKVHISKHVSARHRSLHKTLKGRLALEMVDPDDPRLVEPTPAYVAALIEQTEAPHNGCGFRCLSAFCGAEGGFLAEDWAEAVAHAVVAHDPKPPIDCQYCGQTQKSKVHLSKHISARHREEHREKKLIRDD